MRLRGLLGSFIFLLLPLSLCFCQVHTHSAFPEESAISAVQNLACDLEYLKSYPSLKLACWTTNPEDSLADLMEMHDKKGFSEFLCQLKSRGLTLSDEDFLELARRMAASPHDKTPAFFNALVNEFTNINEDFSHHIDREVLKTKGLKNIVEELHRENKKFKAFVIDDFEEYAALLKELKEFPDSIRFSVIYKESYGPHRTPLFIEKNNAQFKVLISDSLGQTSDSSEPNSYTREPYRYTRELLPEAKIFIASTKRQSDKTNCPVFSLTDVMALEAMQGEENIFQYIENLSLANKQEKEGWTKVKRLPPELMVGTQSLSELKEYRFMSSSSKKIIDPVLKKHTLLVEGKGEQNTYIQAQYFRFSALAMEAFIKNKGKGKGGDENASPWVDRKILQEISDYQKK